MALQTFSVGSFVSWPDVAEWDGSNHHEIAAWLNDLDRVTDDAVKWRVTAVSDTSSVTFHKPAESGDPVWPARDLVVKRGEWVCAIASPAFVGSHRMIVQALDPAGKWKTSDRHGRPGNLGDIASTLPKGQS